MRRDVIVAAAIVLGAGSGIACSLLTSFDGIAPRDRDGTELDAEASVEDAGNGGCAHVRWPEPPEAVADGPDLGELTSALTEIRVFDPIVQGRPQGYDLDGLCTCPDRPACAGSKPGAPCDTPATGVDNAGDGLFRILAQQGVSLDDTGLRTGIRKGQYGIVVRLGGYDGERDDPDVKVALFNAVAVNGDGGVPREDGTDRWLTDGESLLDGRFPTYFASKAYVRDGVLVAELLRLILRVRIPTGPETWSLLELDLRNAHLVARLGARTGTGIGLTEGRIAGRIPEAAMLMQAMRSGACRDSGLYEAIKPTVCAARDLPLDPSKDGRDLPCDSLSAAVGFTAGAALLAPGSGTRADTTPCAIVPDQCP